jgi:hypothetical protein
MKKLSLDYLADLVALNLRQSIIGTPSEDDLRVSIENSAKMLSGMGEILSDDDRERIMKKLTERLVVNIDFGVKITDPNTYKPWLSYRKAEIDEYYWNRYKHYLLENKRWADNVVDGLDRDGDEILDLLGNPAETIPWKRKGLILGDIQSGKTSNYLAVINKAADAGYKLIILLSGTLEALRKQTQERVDEGFVGINSRNALNKDVDKKYVGVGQYDRRRVAFPLTDIISDFDVKKLQALNFSVKPITEPIVFVVKKNTTVLKHLFSWINSSYKDTNTEKIDAPLLLIDDEADNASVNTKKPELEPTAVNRSIRQILQLFNRSTYVAVTATPFANIFINPEEDKDLMSDLFPSDFIYSLPSPDKYIGSSAIFGENSTLSDCIEFISDANGVFSSEDKSSHNVNALPFSLKKAINYFLLCNVIRDLRGVKNDHRSMLVNVTAYTLPQENTYDLIDIYVDRIQKDIKAYSKLQFNQAVSNVSIGYLHDVYVEMELEKKSGYTFEDALQTMTESTIPIKVTMVNTKTKSRGLERLDYEPYKENGYRVIVIGGNSLSRGITLEGLCVSYFFRESKMYDTLLQMGRWFGYRPGYKDIIKIWMSEQTVEWFSFINKACEELRSEIAYMNKLGQTPSEFGFKVLCHPNTLMITASNKMRTAKPFEQWVSLSGKLIETSWLTRKTISYNYNLTVEFIKQVVAKCKSNSSNDIPKLYFGIESDKVSEFVSNFMSHPGNLVFNARSIGEYINKNQDSLGQWYIYIASGNENPSTKIANLDVNRTKRKMNIDGDIIRVSGQKSRVGSVGAVKIVLSEEQQVEAYDSYKEDLKREGRFKPKSKLSVPDHVYLRYTKHPVLILYFMTCPSKYVESHKLLGDDTIVGLSLGFPRTDEREEKVFYRINKVEQNSIMSIFDSKDSEGDEDDED